MRNKMIPLSVLLTFLYVCTFCASCTSKASHNDAIELADCVNPFIGTDFTGNTYPGAQVPHGMVQLSPDNGLPGWDRIAGYFYPDSTIAGFSHTHLSGTGAGDLYDISFLPVTLPYREAEAPLGIHSKFSHEDESAHAGYYSVRLADYGIKVELTATPRCGIQQYTFPLSQAAILLNLSKAMNWDATTDSYIHQVDSVTVEGYRFSTGWARNQKVFFRTRFSRPFDSIHIDSMAIRQAGRRTGTACDARFYFKANDGEQVTVCTALSGVSLEGAARNLQAEAPHNNFSQYHQQARANWNAALGKVTIATTNTGKTTADTGKATADACDADERIKFYTALYHSLLAPTRYDDVDGSYLGPDGKVHRTSNWGNYSTFSLWDTYRTAHPLYTIIEPQEAADMVRSLVAFGQQLGRLPVWNFYACETDMMIGYHAAAVIADAYLKGIITEGAKEALDLCVRTAEKDDYRGIGLYRQLGYVPYDSKDAHNTEGWSLSKTLEYAFDDWAIAQLAFHVGEKTIGEEYLLRAQFYRNTYNPATGFMQPRDSQGRFIAPFSPDDYTEDICESNGWQYFWSVQHDIEGLIELAGGRQRFEAKLDSMFTYAPKADDNLPIFSTGMIGQYVHGNEPSHHVAYLYNFIDQPHKAQQRISQIMTELYKNEPAGLCGNEDCGQTSAWYVMSAMGFYPVNPVGGRYELGTPRFPEMTINLPDGKRFTIKAPGVDPAHPFVKRVLLNGKPYDKTYIMHSDIMQGGELFFEMNTEMKN